MHQRKDRKARIRRIRRENTRTEGYRANRVVVLYLDHQSFAIDGLRTLKHAWWLRTQLAIALCRFKFRD